jgi:O-antigen/teichoic acid export membrane protein
LRVFPTSSGRAGLTFLMPNAVSVSKTPLLEPALRLLPSSEESRDFRQQMGHISRQSSVFFVGTIFTAATGYLFKIYLARVLGAEALGIYALGMTIVGFLGIFNALGLPQAAVRFVAAYCATGKTELLRGFLGRGMLLLLLSNIVLGGVVLRAGPWIALRFYHTQALRAYLGWFALIMVVGALNTFLGQVLAGYKDVARRTLITNFIGSPAMMVLTLALVALGMGLRGYLVAQVGSAAMVLALLAAVVWRTTPGAARSFAAKLPALEKEVMSFSAVILGTGILEFLMSQADKILIGFYLGAREVGIYAVATALVTFVPILLQSVNQIFSASIADLYARGQQELLGRVFQTLTKWILGLTIPLAAVMILFASPLMRIFGRDFAAGWPILVIGTIGQLVNCGVGSVGYLLLMSGNQRRLIRIEAVMAALMVLLNLLLIPHWGITGAAMAAAITNVMGNVWYLGEVRSRLGLWPYNRSYLRLALPLGGTLAVLFGVRMVFGAIRQDWAGIGSALLLGYLAFIAIALACGLDGDDQLIAKAVWARVSGTFRRAEVSAT